MANTKIEWATKVWNPITGCTPISAGCDNCYAKRMATRLKGRHGYNNENPFAVTLHHDKLDDPEKWKTPQRVFVCSMGDIFHENSYHNTIDRIHFIMCRTTQHTFMLLTKRPGNAFMYYHRNANWNTDNLTAPNIWLGVTVEDQEAADKRIPVLQSISAGKRFVSCEPLLSPVDLQLSKYNIDWVIAGGETGPKARPCHPDWIRSLRDQCKKANVPFFFKGWGEYKNGSDYVNYKSQNHIVLTNGEYARWDNNDWKSISAKYTAKQFNDLKPTVVSKVGKKLSGDVINGQQYHELPKI